MFRWIYCPKLSLIELLVIVVIVGVLVGLALPTGDWDSAHRFPPIGPNPGNGFAAVAGEYSQGAARGRNWRLCLLPDGRYSFVWSGFCGVYNRESGTLNRDRGSLVLSPVKPIEPRMERVFLPLKWGRRSYLIPPAKLPDFCDAIIQGDEPRNEAAGNFYVLGLNNRVVGTPILPAPWAAYLRMNLVIGTIVEVTADGRAKIDVGSADGICVGGFLTIQGRDRGMSRLLKVVSVSKGSCEVEGESEEVSPGKFVNPVELGWTVVAARETEADTDERSGVRIPP